MRNWIRNQLSRLPALPTGRAKLALIAGIVVFSVVMVAGITVLVLTSGDSADNYRPAVVEVTPTKTTPAPVAPPVKQAPPAPVVEQTPVPEPVTPAPSPSPRVVTKVRPTDIGVVGSSTPGRTRYEFRDGYLIITSDVEELNIEADGAEGDEQDTIVTGRMGQPQEVRIEGNAPATLRYRAGEGLTVETDGRNLSIR